MLVGHCSCSRISDAAAASMGRAVAEELGAGGVGVAVTDALVDGEAAPLAVTGPPAGPLPRAVLDGVVAPALLVELDGAAPPGVEPDAWPQPASRTAASTESPARTGHPTVGAVAGAPGRRDRARRPRDAGDSGVRRTINGANRCVTDRTDARQ
jgi:hypothetical protein